MQLQQIDDILVVTKFLTVSGVRRCNFWPRRKIGSQTGLMVVITACRPHRASSWHFLMASQMSGR